MKSTIKIITFMFLLSTLVDSVYAETPREQLKQMVELLQQSPNDNDLRQKIIRLAPTLKPAPAIPEESNRREGRGKFAFKSAKSLEDYLTAASEFEGAIISAPWVTGYYSDLCTIYEKAEKYAEAKRNCEFYLVGLVDPSQISETKQRIAGLEFGIEKLASEKRRVAVEADSPRGRAAAMLALLHKQYAGPVKKLLICGVLSNQYWQCTDEDARGSNWVDSVNVAAWPKPGVGPVEYKLVGAESDVIKVSLGTYSWPNGSLLEGGFRGGCAKPNDVNPNSMTWVNCPGWEKAGQPMNVEVRFMNDANGSPLIEYRDSLPCGDARGCRRAQFTLHSE